MCTGKNNDKNKTNLPPPPFHSVFLIAEKLLSSVCLTFCEKLSLIAWVD